jgi:hypothetical protein
MAKKHTDGSKRKKKPRRRVDKSELVGRAVPLDRKFAAATAHLWALTRPVEELPEMLEAVAAQIREIGGDKILTVSVALEAVDDATIAVYYSGDEYWARRQAADEP